MVNDKNNLTNKIRKEISDLENCLNDLKNSKDAAVVKDSLDLLKKDFSHFTEEFNEVVSKNTVLAKSNSSASDLFTQLEEYKAEQEKKNKALAKANVRAASLFVELEEAKLDLEEKNKKLNDMFSELKSANEELVSIHEIIDSTNRTLDLNQIMETVIKILGKLINFKAVSIKIYDKKNSQIIDYWQTGFGEDKQTQTNTHDIESYKSIITKVVQEQKCHPLTIEEAEKKYPEDYKIFNENDIKISYNFPLIVTNQVIGVIILFSDVKRHKPDKKKSDKINKIILNIANSINNAVIFDELKNTKLELAESKKIEQLTQAFEKFVPTQLVKKISSGVYENISLTNYETENLGILFSDIRGFLNLSDTISNDDLYKYVNDYFKCMTSPIHEHSGVIDKFIGDSIMALFLNDPNKQQPIANNAIHSAIAMLRALSEFNETNFIAKIFKTKMGIGIHVGEAIIGTVGTDERMSSTVLGTAVNIASRLEGLTKIYKCPLIISDETFKLIDDPSQFSYRHLGSTYVRGKKEPMMIYEIFDSDSDSDRYRKTKTATLLKVATECIAREDWEQALKYLDLAITAFPEDDTINAVMYQTKLLAFVKGNIL